MTAASEQKKERFQLVIIDDSAQKFDTLRRCVGKKVAVDGVIWEAFSGYHHTPFLITVRAIQEEQPCAAANPAIALWSQAWPLVGRFAELSR